MKQAIAAIMISFFSISAAQAGVSMKLEGSCKMSASKSKYLTFDYFSSFNGCSNKSNAAFAYAGSTSSVGLYTGTREFVGDKDVYSFSVTENGRKKEVVRLTFANSTGNTSGVMTYVIGGKRYTRTVQCDIRDYSYSEC